MITSGPPFSRLFSKRPRDDSPLQAARNFFQSDAGARLSHPHGDARVHLPVPDDRAARLRDAPARVRARSQVRRAEVAQALRLVLPQRGRLPRGGHQPRPRRPRGGDEAALHAPGGEVQRARRHLHERRRGASQGGLEAQGVNPLLARLQPYPFERMRGLLADLASRAGLKAIDLSIGEPKHATPQFIKDALVAALDGLASYPKTAGLDELRQAIAGWLARRYGIPAPDPATQVLPINGSREALFSFAQTVLAPGGKVVSPNPFYQIYEGATLLAGCTPLYAENVAEHGDWDGVQLVYVCSPGN